MVFLQDEGNRPWYLHDYTDIDGVRGIEGNPDIMDGVTLGPLTKVVHADRSVTLSVDVTAPNLPGAWTWQLEYLPSGPGRADEVPDANSQPVDKTLQHSGGPDRARRLQKKTAGCSLGPATIPIDFSYALLTAPTGDSAVDDATRETVVPVKVSDAQSRLRWGTRESVYPPGWLNPASAQATPRAVDKRDRRAEALPLSHGAAGAG